MEGDAATPITRLGSEERLDLGRDGREVLLDARKVSVTFKVEGGTVEAVREMNFQVHRGETIAIVGESGSGKSVTARTVMRLLSKRAKIAKETKIVLDGQDLLAAAGAGNARAARQQGLDDLPGADELAQPGLHRRQADRGGAAPPQPHLALRCRRSGRWRCSRRCASPSPRRGSSSTRTSSPAASASG